MRQPWLLFLLCIGAAYSARAEPMPLPEVLERSLKSSASAARIRSSYADRVAEGTAATTLSNPEMQADILRRSSDGGSNLDVELTQPLRVSQLNGDRTEYAAALRQAASTEQHYELFKTVNQISALYLGLWQLQERKALYERLAEDADKVAGTIRSAARQGQTAVSDSTLFTADSLRLTVEAENIAADIARAKSELTKTTGFSFADIEAVKPDFTPPPSTERLVQLSAERANFRSVAGNDLTAARKRLQVAETDRLPAFGPRIFYSNSNDDSDRGVGIGFALSIPLWDTNQAERQRASAAVAAAETTAETALAKTPEAVIEPLRQGAIRQQARADKYWTAILPAYRKSYALSRDMLRVGQIPALGLWQVREKLYQVEESAIQATVDAYAARLAIELEIGAKLEEAQ